MAVYPVALCVKKQVPSCFMQPHAMMCNEKVGFGYPANGLTDFGLFLKNIVWLSVVYVFWRRKSVNAETIVISYEL